MSPREVRAANPHACDECGTSNDDCLSRVHGIGWSCCGPCGHHDTHGALVPVPKRDVLEPDLRRELNEALDWNANLVRRIEPVVARAIAQARAEGSRRP